LLRNEQPDGTAPIQSRMSSRGEHAMRKFKVISGETRSEELNLAFDNFAPHPRGSLSCFRRPRHRPKFWVCISFRSAMSSSEGGHHSLTIMQLYVLHCVSRVVPNPVRGRIHMQVYKPPRKIFLYSISTNSELPTLVCCMARNSSSRGG